LESQDFQSCRAELGLHCGEELINVFMGVTYYQEAENDLLKHIKCSKRFCSQPSNYQLANKGCEVKVSLGHKSLGDC
jgi:hypothetical protein